MTNPNDMPVIELTPAPEPNIDENGVETLVSDPFEDADSSGHPQRYKRTPKQREADLRTIRKLIHEQRDIDDIASELSQTRPYKLSNAQVRVDIGRLERRYRERFEKPKSMQRVVELDWLGYLQGELQRAWQRSQLTSESLKIEVEESGKSGGKTKRTKSSEKQVGDVRYIDAMIRISELRVKILGIALPQDTAPESRSDAASSDIAKLREAYAETMRAKILADIPMQIEDQNGNSQKP